MESFGEALRRLRGSRSVRDIERLAHISKAQISRLEHGLREPTPVIASALDRALGAQGELVALAVAPSEPAQTVGEHAEALQRGLLDSITQGPLSDAALDDIEWRVSQHGRATRYRPEREILPDLVADTHELKHLLAQHRTDATRRRLTVAVARAAGLMARTLLVVGDDRAKGWWRTGRAAAAAAEDRPTLSWLCAQEAYQLYYDDDLRGAIDLADRARYWAGPIPSVGPALAAPIAARAQAQLAQRDETAASLDLAYEALEQLPIADRAESAFGYSESQLNFHAGDAWLHLGDTTRALAALDRALELYPRSEHADRALVQLDRARCITLAGDPASGAEQAISVMEALPAQYRTPLIISHARQVADKVPAQAISISAVQLLRDTLSDLSE